MRPEVVTVEKTTWMLDYFNWNWYNVGHCWDMWSIKASWTLYSPYGLVFAVWMRIWTDGGACRGGRVGGWQICRLDVLLENKFTKSLWLCDVSFRIWETSIIVTNCWLEDQFQDSLQKDKAVLEDRMEQFLAYLVHEESLRRSQQYCKWTATLHEANNGLFKKWVNGQLNNDLKYNLRLWQHRFMRSFIVLGLAWRRSLLFGRNTLTECGIGIGRSIITDTYACAACVCGDL